MVTRYGKIKIVGAHWTRLVNMLHMECSCGGKFEHRADRVLVKCTKCGITENIHNIREGGKP